VVARRRGLHADARDIQQEVGASLVAAGWEPFCRAVLSEAGWQPGQPLVVDGIRHAEALSTLRSIAAPLPVVLVYIALDKHTRADRMRAEGIDDPRQRRRIESHSTEVQVATLLPPLADVTMDGSRPEADLINEIVRRVQQDRT
jgi:hypothetical protein